METLFRGFLCSPLKSGFKEYGEKDTSLALLVREGGNLSGLILVTSQKWFLAPTGAQGEAKSCVHPCIHPFVRDIIQLNIKNEFKLHSKYSRGG